MKNNLFCKRLLNFIFSAAFFFTSLMSSSMISNASEIVVDGTDNCNQEVEIIADVKAVYSVVVPSYLELECGYNEEPGRGQAVYGYWNDASFGCCGKILPDKKVLLQFGNNVLTGQKTNKSLTIEFFNADTKQFESVKDNSDAELSWNYETIGSCTYDGIAMHDKQYNYQSRKIGFQYSAVTESDTYKGNLVINYTLTDK